MITRAMRAGALAGLWDELLDGGAVVSVFDPKYRRHVAIEEIERVFGLVVMTHQPPLGRPLTLACGADEMVDVVLAQLAAERGLAERVSAP